MLTMESSSAVVEVPKNVRDDLAATPRTTMPDFFIVGAPRCGTTALYSYLRSHPDVFMPARKEPHFFSTDLDGPTRVREMAEYRALFEPARAGARVGEASVYYLTSREAPGRIRRTCPEAKIVAVLRDPIEQMYSNHRVNHKINVEDEFDFERALGLEEERKAGRRIAPWVEGDVYKLFYRETASYSAQVQRYFDEFGRDRVCVVLYDDLRNDPARVYGGLCRFLDIEPERRMEFAVINENREPRSRWYTSLLRTPPRPLVAAARLLVPRPTRAKLMHRLWQASLVSRDREPLRASLRRRLAGEFREEVRRLGRMIDRDLSHWCSADPA